MKEKNGYKGGSHSRRKTTDRSSGRDNLEIESIDRDFIDIYVSAMT